MANRLTKAEMKALLDAAGMTPEQAGLPADLRVPGVACGKRKKSNVHARTDADADMVRRPPGTIIAAGCVVGRAVGWKAPEIGRDGGVVPTPDYRRYKAWRDTVRAFVKVEMVGRRPYGHPVALELSFYLHPGGQVADTTNLQKAAEDGLQGAAIVNDAQVEGVASNRWLVEDEPERLEYVVVAR